MKSSNCLSGSYRELPLVEGDRDADSEWTSEGGRKP